MQNQNVFLTHSLKPLIFLIRSICHRSDTR